MKKYHKITIKNNSFPPFEDILSAHICFLHKMGLQNMCYFVTSYGRQTLRWPPHHDPQLLLFTSLYKHLPKNVGRTYDLLLPTEYDKGYEMSFP